MPQSRQLAAIMFTDIVGYTALMGRDEQKAFELLNKNRKIHKPVIEAYHGRWIKELGDGVMASFQTVSDAVHAAIKIQEACNAANEFQLRIGIHLGEVILENDDVFGDGVNIAARIQAAASPGSIYISESVNQIISNKREFQTRFAKEEHLKNVKDPVRLYEVVINHELLVKAEHIIAPSPKITTSVPNSIAVLPFANMSSDPDQEYFSDGITEEIITDLSQLHDMLVISRSTVMAFKNTGKKIKDIANELNVHYVLEGSVRKAGNNLRITAQLIDAGKDAHIWAEKYNGTLDDIFEIQEKVSRSIVNALKIKLSAEDENNIKFKKIHDAIIYEQYLLARNEAWKCTKESLARSITIIENSISLIGRNEYLLVAMGLAYYQYINLGINPDPENLDKAENLIDEALQLDPRLSKAHLIKSMIHETRGKLKEAIGAAKEAIQFNPNDSESLMMISFLYSLAGRPESGKGYAEKAIKLDPLNPIIHFSNWWINLAEGKLEAVLKSAHTMYNLDKENVGLSHLYAHTLVMNNKIKEATEVYNNYIIKNPDSHYSNLGKCYILAINHENEKVSELISEDLIKAADMDHLWAWFLAELYSILGEKDKSIHFLERATRDAFINYPFFAFHDPLLENVRGELKFKSLMKQVKHKWESFVE